MVIERWCCLCCVLQLDLLHSHSTSRIFRPGTMHSQCEVVCVECTIATPIHSPIGLLLIYIVMPHRSVRVCVCVCVCVCVHVCRKSGMRRGMLMTVLQQYAQEQDVWRGKPGERCARFTIGLWLLFYVRSFLSLYLCVTVFLH